MSTARFDREGKRQLGQFFTPDAIAAALVGELALHAGMRTLEPAFGNGAFLFALAERVCADWGRDAGEAFLADRLHGCELDAAACSDFARRWARRFPHLPVPSGLHCGDFFHWLPELGLTSRGAEKAFYRRHVGPYFDLIIGNPPFGGSIAPEIQDQLDAALGVRNGEKIKKETYAFFIVKCIDLLKPEGRLVFICSDTMLSINTMAGLRKFICGTCDVDVEPLPGKFAETMQSMIVLKLRRRTSGPAGSIRVFGREIPLDLIRATPNFSWLINAELARYFTGATLGDKMIATSGMTVGRNELFLREIHDSAVTETLAFELSRRPVTLERELKKARLGILSARRKQDIQAREARGETEEFVVFRELERPVAIPLPSPDYRYYNKANRDIVYAPPGWVIFWRDEGRYVYTFKKSGNWYLHGVGGRRYFGREGLTWGLISSRMNMKYLPHGYILDSGAPCAFLRDGVPREEMFFILAWCLTETCNRILKTVINHTRNIQGKDFERLPYPAWVGKANRRKILEIIRRLLDEAQKGRKVACRDPELRELDELFNRFAPPSAGRSAFTTPPE